jgi:hypothetical protein
MFGLNAIDWFSEVEGSGCMADHKFTSFPQFVSEVHVDSFTRFNCISQFEGKEAVSAHLVELFVTLQSTGVLEFRTYGNLELWQSGSSHLLIRTLKLIGPHTADMQFTEVLKYY